MNNTLLFVLVMLVPMVLSQDFEEDRGLHKKKRRPYQQSPCGGFRDASGGSAYEDGRSAKLVAALGGAAAGYYLGMKHQGYQQPVINNIINTNGGGGYPCGGPAYGGGAPSGGLLGGGGLLGSHLGGGGLLGALTGPRYGGGVNWDRTIRQFNREVVRPITRWL